MQYIIPPGRVMRSLELHWRHSAKRHLPKDGPNAHLSLSDLHPRGFAVPSAFHATSAFRHHCFNMGRYRFCASMQSLHELHCNCPDSRPVPFTGTRVFRWWGDFPQASGPAAVLPLSRNRKESCFQIYKYRFSEEDIEFLRNNTLYTANSHNSKQSLICASSYPV